MAAANPNSGADVPPEGEKPGLEAVHLEHSLRAGLSYEDSLFLHNTSDKEKARIYRKVDFRLTPMLILLYLISNLDRANIGNAKIQGLEKSLNMSGTDYNVASMVFFVSYIICEVPSNAILVKFTRPSVYIGILVTAWGIIMTCSGVVKSFGGLVATRFLLGVFEAGFFPGAVFLISQWYPPHMTQVRMSIMYAAAAVSGAFSGLLAAGIARMDGTGGYEGWRWIFIIEGVVTVGLGALAFFILPDSPSLSGRWLSDSEMRFLNLTYIKYRGVRQSSEQAAEETEKKFKWSILFSVLTDWQLYLQAMIFMSSSVPVYAFKFSMPQIILNMGFTSSQAQLLTAPPYLVGAFSAVVSSYFADRYTWRLPFILAPQTLVVIAYAILFSFSSQISSNVALCYTAVHLATIGCYPIVPGANTWTVNNLAGSAKRAMGIAFMIGVGNIGGIVGSFIFREEESPRYQTGWGTCLGFVVAGMMSASILEAGYYTINKRRSQQTEEEVRQRYSDDQLEKLGDRSPLFRYTL
ncbi:permease of the major facilitator superfamily [Thozetella sp. PMI_491]|nr:permease of the major facilitator superfamily [Thozetella sp. PMI_491]